MLFQVRNKEREKSVVCIKTAKVIVQLPTFWNCVGGQVKMANLKACSVVMI